MHIINLHKDNKITKRELKDLALNKNLIQVGKKDTLDKEERSDQAAYMALNKNLSFVGGCIFFIIILCISS
jgi:hypothetical protein